MARLYSTELLTNRRSGCLLAQTLEIELPQDIIDAWCGVLDIVVGVMLQGYEGVKEKVS